MKLVFTTVFFLLYLANHQGRAQRCLGATLCDGGRSCYSLDDECNGRRACEDGSDEAGIHCYTAELIGGLTGALIFIIVATILIVVISVYCYRFRKHRKSQPANLPSGPSTTKHSTISSRPTVSESPNTVTWSSVTNSGNTITQVTVHVTHTSSGDIDVATEVNSEQSKANTSATLTSAPPPPYSEKDSY